MQDGARHQLVHRPVKSNYKMNIDKTEILNRICYSELVYKRINRKLASKYSKPEIEKMIFGIIQEMQKMLFQKIGKNIYVTNAEKHIKITINQNTHRIITVDRIAEI